MDAKDVLRAVTGCIRLVLGSVCAMQMISCLARSTFLIFGSRVATSGVACSCSTWLEMVLVVTSGARVVVLAALRVGGPWIP